jgi:osmotically-inducible protein OsmY
MWDVWIDDALIDLIVKNGEVTLSGVVGSLAEKTRAFEDAWVTGVVSVDDSQLAIDWTRRDEMRRPMEFSRLNAKEIRRAIEDAFSYDPRVAPFNIDLRIENGIVTLSGVVDNLKAREAAAEDARNTRGVWWVKNHLKVRPSVGPIQRPIQDADREIAQKVRVAFLRDPIIEQHEITVTVNNYAVKLEGRVDSRFEKSLAEDVASRVHGVVTVFNELTIPRDWQVKPDWQIEMQIAEELDWSPFVDEDRIAVTVHDGVATLTGAVDDLKERRAATVNAYEGGARQVRNQLQVLYGPQQLRPRQ